MKTKYSVTDVAETIGDVYSYLRWSTSKQSWGDSERRQNALAEAWCKLKELPPPKEVYSDSGVSSKSGKNRAKGSAFAELLDIVQPSDLIIIEDVDRWGRQDPITSLSAMRKVLQEKSISIRFINENITVNQTNFNDDGIILPLFLKSWLGNRENTKKATRIKEVWVERRLDFEKTGKPYGQKVPFWLKWVPTGIKQGYYEINEERAKVVLLIYELCRDGMGARVICRTLNERNIPKYTKYEYRKGKHTPIKWNLTTIQRILHTKYVLGYDPGTNSDKKMFPPVPGITEKLWYACQKKMEERQRSPSKGQIGFSGRTDSGRNLFSSIAKCSDPACHKSLHSCYAEKTSVDGVILRYDYLRCRGAATGVCNLHSGVDSNKMEESFMTIISGSFFVLDLGKPQEMGNNSQVLAGKIAESKVKLEKYTALMEQNPSDTLAGLMQKQETEQKRLMGEMETASVVEFGSTPFREAEHELRKMFYEDWTKREVRLKIRELIRTMVSEIIVDLKAETYDVFWEGFPKPTHVELLRKAFRIDGKSFAYSADWKKHVAEFPDRVKEAEK